MPIDHSPVKTRANTKVSNSKDKATAPPVQRALSDPVIGSGPADMEAAILAAVESVLSSPDFINKLVSIVAAKITETVLNNLQTSLEGAIRDIERLKDDNKKLCEQFESCRKRQDEHEQYLRRNNLRIFGVAESEGEDTDSLVLDIFNSKLNLDLTCVDIDRSHRVGVSRPGPDGRARPRPIIVKFVSYRSRRMVFTNKKKLKGSGITVREDLTPHRAALLRQATERYGTASVWTLDGRIIWTDGNKRGSATWTL